MPVFKMQTATDNKQSLPGLNIRPAQLCDFPRMARMANEVFQHERDIDYFNKNHHVKIGTDAEVRAVDKLLEADKDFRLADMHVYQRRPGRHYMVATCIKQPTDYLMRRHRDQPREEIVGWAEWQDPGHFTRRHITLSRPNTWLLDSDDGSDNDDRYDVGSHFSPQKNHGLDGLEPILHDMIMVNDANRPLVVPPNGLAVDLADVLASFRRAGVESQEKFKHWCKDILSASLGQNGDSNGNNIVLRSLIIPPMHWDTIVGRALLKWGLSRAIIKGWEVQALTAATSASTAASFRAVGFVESERLDVFRDTQIVLRWDVHANERSSRARLATKRKRELREEMEREEKGRERLVREEEEEKERKRLVKVKEEEEKGRKRLVKVKEEEEKGSEGLVKVKEEEVDNLGCVGIPDFKFMGSGGRRIKKQRLT